MNSSNTLWNVRPLQGWVIGISIGIPEDLPQFGLTADNVNRTTVLICEALLSVGARLIFGHDWRQDGIMNAVFKNAVRYQSPISSSSVPEPLIQSLLPWPDQPTMDVEMRRDLEQRGILKIGIAGKPEGDWKSTNDTSARSISLTNMRRSLAKKSDARVCIGGRVKSAQGIYSGVVEEAAYQAESKKPLFLGGFLGGATQKLIEAIRERNERASVLHAMDVHIPAFSSPSSDKSSSLPESLADCFLKNNLQSTSGLNRAEWQAMLDANDIVAFSALVITGLSRLPNPVKKK